MLTCREQSFGRPAPGARGGAGGSRSFDGSDFVLSGPMQREGTRRSKLACPGLVPPARCQRGARPPPVPFPRSAGTERPREVAVRCRAALGGRGERSPADPERRWAGLGCPPAPLLAVPARRSCGKALFLVGGNSDLCLFR